ncbi:Uncharacterised protein [Actinomyces bovis]|uniref:N-acetyltransferase domain-containing protein n=1 Tax=Actinomyces bovis TaxID=1658 RepID=A0ABY1VMA1_9ACTO|nr:GNAT family N-acetyltransferase [Actinomyces bovis]SPT53200.1 Uncharacterised protein [Actinomyces bovis]VEG52421.1 Uncharacterised protein [Actinomyces israelii]
MTGIDSNATQQAATANSAAAKPSPVKPDQQLIVRPARADDVHRVALLLTLRGRELDQTIVEAPAMIEAFPVLLLARLVEPAAVLEDEDSQAPPVALAGAFVLPAAEDHAEQWMVTGPIVDPDCPRGGIGRELLGAVVEAVAALDPGSELHAVVPADAHATIALHRSLGFTEQSRSHSFDELDFGEDTALLLVRQSTPPAQA